jgi:cell division protein ZapE
MDTKVAPCTPKSRYRSDLERPEFEPDAAQAHAVDSLQRVFDALVERQARPSSLLKQLLPSRKLQPARGIYLWGSVGRGKTYLMDCFYECLPFPEKRRLHFHHFMRDVHSSLKANRHRREPLAAIARGWSRDARVICFDEFFVDDIADAMLLGNLLRALFAEGVTLVATSNIPPDALYKDGLQRARFLPAIALLKQQTRIVHLNGKVDYRLRAHGCAQTYYIGRHDSALAKRFQDIAGDAEDGAAMLTVQGREIAVRRLARGIAWFDFDTLCESPRSYHDYIEIAQRFHTILISDIPRLDDNRLDATRRLIALIDELYDRGIKLIVSAAAPPEALYTGTRLRLPFERAASRLEAARYE